MTPARGSPGAEHCLLDRHARGNALLKPWRLGITEIDDRLGPDGLEPAALHEIKPAMAGTEPARYDDWAGNSGGSGLGSGWGNDWASAFTAALSFTLALSLCRRLGHAEASDQPPRASPCPGAILWCWPAALAHEIGGLHAPGLVDLGLDPAAMIVAEPDKPAEVLWAMEEGLKAPGLDLVVGVLDEARLTPARRLALAAAAHGTPCLMITDPRTPVAAATATRWRIGRAISGPHPFAHRLENAPPGAPRYRVLLERSRAAGLAGPAPPLILEWSDATHRFSLASPSADRADRQSRSRRLQQ